MTDKLLARRCVVAFIEEEVERMEDSIEPAGDSGRRRQIKFDLFLPDLFPGPVDPPGYCFFPGQEAVGDFANT